MSGVFKIRLFALIVLISLSGCATFNYYDFPEEEKQHFNSTAYWMSRSERGEYLHIKDFDQRKEYQKGLQLCQRIRLYDMGDEDTVVKFTPMISSQWDARVLRRQCYIEDHPDLDRTTQIAIGAGKVFIGMSDKEAIAAWGKPDQIHRTVGSFGQHEQWVYRAYAAKPLFLYFEDQKLTAWQD